MNETKYAIVINGEKQYSINDIEKEIPIGWEAEGTVGSKKECLAYINTVWKDIRPKSIKDYIARKNTKQEGKSDIIVDEKHKTMIDVYQKRYQFGLDNTATKFKHTKKCVDIFFSDYVTAENRDVFELGLGSGKASEVILTKGHRLTGIDVIEIQNWKSLKDKYGDRFKTIVGDFVTYPSDKKYDIVFDNGCLHHFEPDYYTVTLNKIHSILKNDGHFFLTLFKEPNELLKEGHVAFLDSGKRRCKFFVLSEIEQLLNEHNFVLEKSKIVSREVNKVQSLLCVIRKK